MFNFFKYVLWTDHMKIQITKQLETENSEQKTKSIHNELVKIHKKLYDNFGFCYISLGDGVKA